MWREADLVADWIKLRYEGARQVKMSGNCLMIELKERWLGMSFFMFVGLNFRIESRKVFAGGRRRSVVDWWGMWCLVVVLQVY